MTENIRFFKIVDVLKKQKELADYVELAGILNTNKAGISDIKQGRKKLSIDNIRSMKISYPKISIDYIIMGKGKCLSLLRLILYQLKFQVKKKVPL